MCVCEGGIGGACECTVTVREILHLCASIYRHFIASGCVRLYIDILLQVGVSVCSFLSTESP